MVPAVAAASATRPNFNSSQSPFTNFNTTYDVLGNLTKVWGRHTSKVGMYMQKSLKDQTSFTNHNGVINFNDNTSNPFDTSYAAANAAIGVFNNYTQANAYSNGEYRYWNIEWFAQDNWKVNDRLTLDYGLRFYWVQPQHDEAGLTSNFIPELFDANQAVRLYRPGLNASGQRVAVDPVTGQQLAAVNIGRIVPNSGNLTNGIGQSGDAGVPDRLIEDNGILFAPRFGLTYDITGNQSFIFRAGGGVFYDRYEGNISFALISNPPTTFDAAHQLRPAAGDRSGDGAAGAVGPQRPGGRGPGADDLQLQRRLPEEAARRRDLGHRLRRLDRQPPAAAGEPQRGAVRRAVPAARTRTRRCRRARCPARTPTTPTSCGPTRATATSTFVCTTPTRTTTGCRRRSIAASPTASS